MYVFTTFSETSLKQGLVSPHFGEIIRCSVNVRLRCKTAKRPIRREEVIQILQQHSRVFNDIQLELKKSTCEAVMILRSKFLDQSLGLF